MEGRIEGKREALRRLLTARFGTVSGALETRIATLDEAGLDALLIRSVTGASLAELEKED